MAKKKGGNKKKQQQQQGLLAPLTSTSASNRPVWQGDYTPESLRQQQQGAARGGGSGQQHQAASSNPTAWMRAEHLMRLASWASTEVPPLGALLGMRVASMCQSAAFLPPDISPNVTCQWYWFLSSVSSRFAGFPLKHPLGNLDSICYKWINLSGLRNGFVTLIFRYIWMDLINALNTNQTD
jgi:hypothetical protein